MHIDEIRQLPTAKRVARLHDILDRGRRGEPITEADVDEANAMQHDLFRDRFRERPPLAGVDELVREIKELARRT